MLVETRGFYCKFCNSFSNIRALAVICEELCRKKQNILEVSQELRRVRHQDIIEKACSLVLGGDGRAVRLLMKHDLIEDARILCRELVKYITFDYSGHQEVVIDKMLEVAADVKIKTTKDSKSRPKLLSSR
jgi:hypothetical protein